MTTRRNAHRAARPCVASLEARMMLSGTTTARWIGQDAHDLTGPSSVLGGDDVQDIHVALTGLPSDHAITWAKVEALGGGEWYYNGGWGPWAAAVVRDPGATSAEVYFDPYQVETGRPFSITLAFNDGSSTRADFAGGAADPNLRMPAASASLAWIGQDGNDRVGTGPAVGPDSIQDVHLSLANLSPTIPFSSLTITSSSGDRWAWGNNPDGLNDAAVIRSGDRADVYLNPVGDPVGQVFTAQIVYANGKTDSAVVTARAADPSRAQVASAEAVPALVAGVTAGWIGQDGQDLAGPGSARIAVGGIPAGRTVVAASLSDPARGLWVYRGAGGEGFYTDAYSGPLAVGTRAGGNGLDVAFPPSRDEAGGVLTLRLAFDDGSQSIVQVAAGTTDPTLRASGIDRSSVVAHPGDDLNSLANRYGTVRLSAGVYPLNAPLVLTRPVAILGDPGSALFFTQPADAPSWSAAIKIQSGHTTLDGFAVRFGGPVRWSDGVNYGPAVIGTTDNLDTSGGSLMTGLVFTNLDLQSPPVNGAEVEAPRLIRLASAQDGKIANNRLKGGTVEFVGGPWTITGNIYDGTVPNTYTYAVFAGHDVHDLTLASNTAQPVGPSGHSYRFLVLTGTGFNDRIVGNTVVAIGPRDGDAVDRNAAEIILTESYQIRFEGKPSAISDNGLILQIPVPQGETPRTGDMVAILSGPGAGQYRRIAQALSPRTFVLDSPLPAGVTAISIAPGFVNDIYVGNTVDSRGSSGAADLILVGNQYGTKVLNNHFLGGGTAFQISASATEAPVAWGWTHSPFLGATISGNVIEDALRGATISVDHDSAIKTTSGRVYFSGSLTNNRFVWTPAFLAALGESAPLPALTIGEDGSLDPGELRISLANNLAEVPAGATAPTMRVAAARIDGQTVTSTTSPIPLAPPPASPSGLALVRDTGSGNSDGLTADGRLRFDPVAGAVGYEYRLAGSLAYTPVDAPGGFLPAGLAQGANSVLIRTIDVRGYRSADAAITFVLDTVAPSAGVPALVSSDDTGISAVDRVTQVTSPSFKVSGDREDTLILIRDGVEVVRRTGPGRLTETSPRPDGPTSYTLVRIDPAGNAATSAAVVVTIDSTPPGAVGNLTLSKDGQASFSATAPDDHFEYRTSADGAFQPLDHATTFAAPGASSVFVRAVDRAGNAGPEVRADVPTEGQAPSGEWLGQDGQDLVGPWQVVAPDGTQDVHIAIRGLDPARQVVFVDIQGLGDSQWQFGGPWGPWKAQFLRVAGSASGDLYIHPDRVETGRPFTVTVRYDDGTTASFWMNGGTADPQSKVASARSFVGGATPTGPIARRSRRTAAKKAAQQKALAHARHLATLRARARELARKRLNDQAGS